MAAVAPLEIWTKVADNGALPFILGKTVIIVATLGEGAGA